MLLCMCVYEWMKVNFFQESRFEYKFDELVWSDFSATTDIISQ